MFVPTLLPIAVFKTIFSVPRWSLFKRLGSGPIDNFLPAYGLLNASVGLKDIGGRPIDLTLFANNITNEAKPVGVLDQYAGSSGTVGLTYTEPRMYGVRIGYRFGN